MQSSGELIRDRGVAKARAIIEHAIPHADFASYTLDNKDWGSFYHLVSTTARGIIQVRLVGEDKNA